VFVQQLELQGPEEALNHAVVTRWRWTTPATPRDWITRKVSVNGVITVAWQQISVGKHREGRRLPLSEARSASTVGPTFGRRVL
jgi:hypothetical protein